MLISEQNQNGNIEQNYKEKAAERVKLCRTLTLQVHKLNLSATASHDKKANLHHAHTKMKTFKVCISESTAHRTKDQDKCLYFLSTSHWFHFREVPNPSLKTSLCQIFKIISQFWSHFLSSCILIFCFCMCLKFFSLSTGYFSTKIIRNSTMNSTSLTLPTCTSLQLSHWTQLNEITLN